MNWAKKMEKNKEKEGGRIFQNSRIPPRGGGRGE